MSQNYLFPVSLWDFSLALVCPLTIKKSIGLQRGQNDRVDTKRIANYAVLHYRKLELYKLPDKDLVRPRGWIIIRDNLVKHKVIGNILPDG